MHGDIMHIFGNMLFLWIFGDNIENLHRTFSLHRFLRRLRCRRRARADRYGTGFDHSDARRVGRDFSGVLGGYLLLFPTRQVRVLIFRIYTTVPAYVALGFWIGYQILLGYLTPSGTGGVAYAAHIGGFIAGLALIKVFAIGTKAQDVKPLQG